MKYGIQEQLLQLPVDEVFSEAKRLGFDGLEFNLPPDYTADVLWSEEGRARLRRLGRETGVEIASVGLGGAMLAHTFASDEEDDRTHAERNVMEACHFTPEELDTSVILVPLVGIEGQDPAEGRKRWIEGLRPCSQLAEQTGAILALENIVGGHPPAQSAEDIAAVIAGIGSPAVRAYYDVGNGKALGFDPLDELRRLGARVVQVHIKGPRGAQLYENKLDMTAVAQTLKAMAYDGYLVFETRPTEAPSEAARKNLAILRREIEAAYA